MTLAAWLKQYRMTNLELAQKIGVSEECARLYRAGMRRPGPIIAKAIIDLTANAVTFDDLQQAYEAYRLKKDPQLHGLQNPIHAGTG